MDACSRLSPPSFTSLEDSNCIKLTKSSRFKRFELHFRRPRIFNWILQLMDIGPNLFYSPSFPRPHPVRSFGSFNLGIQSSISALICAHISAHFGSSADNPSSRESNLDISQQIDCTGIPLLLQPIRPIDCDRLLSPQTGGLSGNGY